MVAVFEAVNIDGRSVIVPAMIYGAVESVETGVDTAGASEQVEFHITPGPSLSSGHASLNPNDAHASFQ